MINENQERWKSALRKAAVEQDPVKLHHALNGGQK
jgi:hypothetical protein